MINYFVRKKKHHHKTTRVVSYIPGLKKKDHSPIFRALFTPRVPAFCHASHTNEPGTLTRPTLQTRVKEREGRSHRSLTGARGARYT